MGKYNFLFFPQLSPSLPINASSASSSCDPTTITTANTSPIATGLGTAPTGSAQQQNQGPGNKKGSSPQFRWRRRKRRSKAQYPEMGRYLLPIDNGDEIQHLGRTLECQLCGLRGKQEWPGRKYFLSGNESMAARKGHGF